MTMAKEEIMTIYPLKGRKDIRLHGFNINNTGWKFFLEVDGSPLISKDDMMEIQLSLSDAIYIIGE